MPDDIAEPHGTTPPLACVSEGAETSGADVPVAPAPKKKRFVSRIGFLRLVVFFVVLTLAYAGPQILLQSLIMPHVAKEMREWVALATAAITCLLSISVYALLVGWMERRHIIELNLGRGIPLVLAGTALAILMFCILYALLFGLHAATWMGLGSTKWLLPMVSMALASGVCEELIFRAGIYRITEDMFGTGIALLISGALFGLLHLANPHSSLLAAGAIALEAGVLLGAAYAATRNLWFPIGIHMGWNFAEGGIFGAAVSGGKPGHGLLNFPLHGPDWLTGGGFGPEASVVTVVVCTAAGIYFVWRTIRTGRWCRIGFRMLLD